MRNALFVLLLAVLAVGAAWALAALPGSVTAQLGTLTLETSLPIAVLLAIVVLTVVALLVRLLVGFTRLPQRARATAELRRRRQGDDAVHRTLLALAAGDPAARREADEARRRLGDTPLTLLLAAQSARGAGRDAEADTVLQAMTERDDSRFLGLRGLLRAALDRGDTVEAERLAELAEKARPGAPWIRAERARLAVGGGRWRDALALAPRDAAPGVTAAYALAAAGQTADSGERRRLVRQAWEADPGLTPAAIAHARELFNPRKRAAVLRRAWTACPHPDLAALAMESAPDAMQRLAAAQALVVDLPEAGDSHLLLARASLEAGLTGEARRHAEAARAAGVVDRRLQVILADVAEAEGDRDGARQALRDAATASAGPVWRCAACGTQHDAWHPVCSSCGTPGRISWTTAAAHGPLLLQSPASLLAP
jgi:HemY protein